MGRKLKAFSLLAVFSLLLYAYRMVAGLLSPPVFRGLFFFAVCFAAVLSPVQAKAGGSAPERYSVAMRNFGVWEPQTKERLDFSVWYPSRGAAADSIREGWIVEASHSNRILPGFYPVILVSHDTASGRFANNDLAGALAAAGMIVIVPAHTDDNQNASAGIYTARLLKERPRHLLRALETVLGTPDFAPHADESRIGLLGVGFGAITVMQLAGAVPDFSRLQGYCGAASGSDAFCSLWTRERLGNMPQALSLMAQKEGQTVLSPPLDLFAPTLMPVAVSPAELQAASDEKGQQTGAKKPSFWQRLFAGAEEEPGDFSAQSNATIQASSPVAQNVPAPLDFQGGPMFGGTNSGALFVYIPLPGSSRLPLSLPEEPADDIKPEPVPVTADPALRAHRRPPEVRKIRGIALLAPAGGMLFSRTALENIRIPVALVEAGQDGLYPPQQHAYPYFANLSVQPMRLQLSGVDHFSLFARCAKDTMINLGDVCGRMVGDARQELAGKRDTFLVPFFQSALGGPLPSALPSGYIADERTEEQP